MKACVHVVYVGMNIYACECVCECMYVCICVCVFICIYVWTVYVCMYVCMYVCIYVNTKFIIDIPHPQNCLNDHFHPLPNQSALNHIHTQTKTHAQTLTQTLILQLLLLSSQIRMWHCRQAILPVKAFINACAKCTNQGVRHYHPIHDMTFSPS